MKPLLICITGADGSGKSTACANVREILTQSLGAGQVLEVSIWDCLQPGAIGVSPTFRTREDAEKYLADLDGSSRTLFIFHAMSRALQLATRRGAAVLLLNGYWFKYAVSEIGYGVPLESVLGAASVFAAPDEVYCLDISAENAWSRRKAATQYEQGPGADFIDFQTRLRAIWSLVEKMEATNWVHLSALLPATEIAIAIASGVLKQLTVRKGAV